MLIAKLTLLQIISVGAKLSNFVGNKTPCGFGFGTVKKKRRFYVVFSMVQI